MWQHLTEQSTTNRALRHSVVQICHDIPLVLHEETAPRLARVGNIHGESLLQHVEVEAYTSHFLHTLTLLLRQLPVEEHLVVSIVDVVRVEEGRHHTAPEYAVPTPHAYAPRFTAPSRWRWPVAAPPSCGRSRTPADPPRPTPHTPATRPPGRR